ncbi:MAG TPA: glycosyltransferase family 4 protein [Patescibacteria group bacterium]|nr:glycosyltransferase family 4 protein [Patescibacteria group bacterium]
MTVLIVSRKYPPSVGGMELFAKELYESLNHQTNVILVKYGGPRLLSPLIIPILWLKAAFFLLTRKIDIIHISDGMQAPIGVLVAKVFNKKSVVVIHGLDFTWPNWLYQKLVPPAVKKSDALLCISRAVKEQVLSSGIDKNKSFFIPLGVKDIYYLDSDKKENRKLLGLDENKPLLLSVGRLVKRKGLTWFIEYVFVQLVKTFPELNLLIVGDGTELQNLEMLVNKYNLSNNVIIKNNLTDKEVKYAYNAADIFVMPNIKVQGDIEGFGLVLLEAASAKLPVVASNIEGIRDAIKQDKNGILIESRNISEFISEITKFLTDKKYAIKFGQNSRDYTLSNYSWDNVASNYIKIYKDLISDQ